MGSTIRCVGSLIDVNNTRMTPPFDIYAIGDPNDLFNAITMPGGVLVPLKLWDINAEVVKLEDFELPPYSGGTMLQYAKPVGEE